MKKRSVVSLSAICLLAFPSIARADVWTVLDFASGDNRLFSDELDWDQGAYKGECGQTWPVLDGVSAMARNLDGYWLGGTHAVLCDSGPSNLFVNLYNTETRTSYIQNFAGLDDRADTSTGDWAYGYWKAECAVNEVVLGVSQYTDGEFSSIHCAATNMKGPTLCAPYNFDGHDGRQPPDRGQDWDQDYWKGECSPGNYVKGVAMSTGEHHQAAVVLCCTPGF